MTRKKRIGIIGTGNISHAHIGAYRKLDNVEVVAACDIDAEKLQAFAEEYGIENTFTDYNEMLKMKDLDGVSVCTWNSVHADASIAALKAGKHVLCEKPLAITDQEALEIQKAAEESGRMLMLGFVMRFEKKAETVMDFIKSGALGDIYFGRAVYLRRVGAPVGWYANKELSGGGPLIDLGVHVVDICHYFMGQPKPKTVSGTVFKNIGIRKNIKAIDRYISSGVSKDDVEDMCVAMIRFNNGSVMEIETSYSQHIKDDTIRIECYGTKGGFVYDYESELTIYTEANDYLADLKPRYGWDDEDEAFRREAEHFVNCMDDKSKCICPVEDGAAITKILNAIYESAEQGREIVVE